MLFSVIVPVYNVEDFLEECLVSILGQTFDDFELILVDDGSIDRSPSICDHYAEKDSRIIVIHKENEGLVSARQDGAKLATGEYICCVDGDDFVSPDFLEQFSLAIAQYNPDIVCSSMYVTDEKGDRPHSYSIKPGRYVREDIERYIFPILLENERAVYFPPSICTKAIKRSLYLSEQLLVDPIIRIGEDRAVTIPCLYRSNCIVLLDKCLYHYRLNILSMTKKKKPFSWEGLAALSEHVRKRIDLNEYDFQAQYDRLIAHQFFLTAKSQFNRTDSFMSIRQEILNERKRPLFENCIRNCHYTRSVKALMMEYTLRLKLVSLIWLFHLITR